MVSMFKGELDQALLGRLQSLYIELVLMGRQHPETFVWFFGELAEDTHGRSKRHLENWQRVLMHEEMYPPLATVAIKAMTYCVDEKHACMLRSSILSGAYDALPQIKERWADDKEVMAEIDRLETELTKAVEILSAGSD